MKVSTLARLNGARDGASKNAANLDLRTKRHLRNQDCKPQKNNRDKRALGLM